MSLALGTPIPTPYGWTNIGEIREGDAVCTELGKQARVEKLSYGSFTVPSYRVSFDDGEVIRASADHQWQVSDYNRRVRNIHDWREHWDVTQPMATEEMAALLRVGKQLRWRVPNTRALEGHMILPPVGMYTLGVWLGRGRTEGIVELFRRDSAEILARMDREGHVGKPLPMLSTAARASYGLSGMITGLSELGVYRDKRIPSKLLRANATQRIELLRGLCDTAGFWHTPTGHGAILEIAQRDLADDATELCFSLGLKVYRSIRITKSGRKLHRLSFRPNFDVFTLARYAREDHGTQRSRWTIRTITSIEPATSVNTRSIDCGGSYLVGRSMIPTS